jgi:hypothetical protein
VASEAQPDPVPRWSRWPSSEPTLPMESKPLPAALLKGPPLSEPEQPTRWVWIAVAVAALFGVAGGGAYYLTRMPAPRQLAAPTSRPAEPAQSNIAAAPAPAAASALTAAPASASAPTPAAAPAPTAAPAPAAAPVAAPAAGGGKASQLASGLRALREATQPTPLPPGADGPTEAAAPQQTPAPTYEVGLRPITPPRSAPVPAAPPAAAAAEPAPVIVRAPPARRHRARQPAHEATPPTSAPPAHAIVRF